MTEILLYLSIAINVALLWYGFILLKKVIYVSGNTNEIIDAVEGFRSHLDGVYELELFYGDETLKSLLDHTGELSTFLAECENAYQITEREYEQYVQNNKEEDETSTDEQGRR
jgi:hypothetical protein